MKKEFTCIVCPAGCPLTVELDEDGVVVSVTGNTCRRGEIYAKEELTDPRRTLTSTVKLEGRELAMLPVRTDKGIRKDAMAEAMEILKTVTVKLPIKRGDVILENFTEEGISLIACKNMD
ncbi:MAG: DUF1667 domain-containing protein [Clostridia bacterium]|nr:DUF1667 domain-containing protein [Clostridia bacterium]